MGLFGKSFEEKVNEALEKLRGQFPHATITASVNDKIVTLHGEAADIGTKGRIMAAFSGLVETDNTINEIRLQKSPAAPVPAATATPAAVPVGTLHKDRFHDVVKGDTLSAVSKRYYGDANRYMKIFDANRDVLTDPDKINVGQKLRIPG